MTVDACLLRSYLLLEIKKDHTYFAPKSLIVTVK
jgi:hypothetical protein